VTEDRIKLSKMRRFITYNYYYEDIYGTCDMKGKDKKYILLICSLFIDVFSNSRLYSVDLKAKMNDEFESIYKEAVVTSF
jgi:hypothetical protein